MQSKINVKFYLNFRYCSFYRFAHINVRTEVKDFYCQQDRVTEKEACFSVPFLFRPSTISLILENKLITLLHCLSQT